MGTWTNNDGLYITYGQTEATATVGGQINALGRDQVIEFDIDLTTLTSTTSTILLNNVVIPDNSQITKVTVLVTEVSAGANANFDLGLIKLDRTTEIDFNGLIAAGDDWHAGAIGTETSYTAGSTEAGALMGTVITDPALIVAYYDTAAFTDGTIKVNIYYHQT